MPRCAERLLWDLSAIYSKHKELFPHRYRRGGYRYNVEYISVLLARMTLAPGSLNSG
jgi:hypothetical protein